MEDRPELVPIVLPDPDLLVRGLPVLDSVPLAAPVRDRMGPDPLVPDRVPLALLVRGRVAPDLPELVMQLPL